MDINEIISSGILETYAMGLCSAEETLQVEQWLKAYPEVAAELASIQSGLENYAAAHAVKPSGKVKEELFARLNLPLAEKPQAPVVPISNRWKWTAAAAILLLAGSAVINIVYYNKYKETDKELASKIKQMGEMARQNEEMKNDGMIVSNPNSMPVSLKGMDNMPDAKAKIFWMQNTGDVFIDATNLPETPAGKQYQFWAIVDGVPVSGGMIVRTAKGSFKLQRMRSFGKAEAFAISLEKEGGVEKPTDVVSMGKIL